MRIRITTAALIASSIVSPLRAMQLPVVTDIQDRLESARASNRRIGVALRNSSMLFETVVETGKRRFTLDEQKLGRRTIRYEDIRALLDPTTGEEVATIRFAEPGWHLSHRAAVGIVAGASAFLFWLFLRELAKA